MNGLPQKLQTFPQTFFLTLDLAQNLGLIHYWKKTE